MHNEDDIDGIKKNRVFLLLLLLFLEGGGWERAFNTGTIYMPGPGPRSVQLGLDTGWGS